MANDRAVPPARTVCHACRGSAHANVPGPDGMLSTRPIVVPGDGEVIKAVMTGHGDDAMVSAPCPVCGDTDDPGWLPGFVVPV